MKYLVYYILAINLFTFVAYGFDKWRARKKARRIPEKTLHWYALLGGSIGALVGQRVFRHKTIKRSFQFVYWVIVILQLMVCGYLIYLNI